MTYRLFLAIVVLLGGCSRLGFTPATGEQAPAAPLDLGGHEGAVDAAIPHDGPVPTDLPVLDQRVPDLAFDLSSADATGTCTPHCTSFSCGGPNGCGATCPPCGAPGSQVFYSVGQNTADHKSGTPLVTITSGVATFTVPQTAPNLGVGDKVLHDGGGRVFLRRKLSASSWQVVTAKGGVPPDVTSMPVISISHEYASLDQALYGAKDGDHIGTGDLTAAGLVLNLPCYHDSGPDQAATVVGFTTDAQHFVRIYTPTDIATECNQPQRHTGKWTPQAYQLVAPSTVDWEGVLNLFINHVRLEGLQIKETTTDASLDGYSAVYVKNQTAGDIRISSCLIWNTSTIPTAGTGGRGIFLSSPFTGTLYLWNSVLYSSGTTHTGLRCKEDPTTTSFVYNNTVMGYTVTGEGCEGAKTFKNNILVGNGSNYSSGHSSASDYNYSDDTTSTGGAHDLSKATPSTWKPVLFVDESNGDLHLAAGDTGATGKGTSLAQDPNLSLGTDMDGDARSGSWDMGADERAP